jgi:hypothetical protein
MNNVLAVLLTIGSLLLGIFVATIAAQTEAGRVVLNLLNLFSLGLGIAYMSRGYRRENMVQMVAGILLIISAVGSLGLPPPLEAGVQLFLGVGGLFVKLPVD